MLGQFTAWVGRIGRCGGVALWGMAALLVGSATVGAAEPTQLPLPVLETGMHTATVGRIATDREGRWAVTASHDKSARVWDVASGQLLTVLRPPQDRGNEGKLFAVALSPDGAAVAVGGWTGWDWRGRSSIYEFDRESGRLTGQIGSLPELVLHLSYSADGRWLAATLSNGELHIVDTRLRKVVAHDADCHADSYSVQFSADDRRLLTTCLDGRLRVYPFDRLTGALGPAFSARPGGGEQPFFARWSPPDSRRIAVGFNDTTVVQVLDGRTLGELVRPDVAGVDNGDLSSVAWSTDGRELIAGGTWYSGGNKARIWRASDGSKVNDVLLTPNDTLMDFAPLPGGGWLFAAADPAWGVLSADRQVRYRLDPAVGVLAGADRLSISSDGLRVRYSLNWQPEHGRSFDLTNRRLGDDDRTLPRPRTASPGLAFDLWRLVPPGTHPTLNGTTLPLDEWDHGYSLSISHDDQRFVLGTNWSLRLYDRAGELQWRRETPEVVWAVNLSTDHAVAAYGDGTIRWHSLARNGAEVLAFFPHVDGQRWVAWTPEGFYAASDDSAEALMGYHLNRGIDRAGEFISARQLREHFYRPELISQRLTADGDALVAAAVAKLGDVRQLLAGAKAPPPKVDLLGLPAPGPDGSIELTGHDEVVVQVRVTDQGGGIGRLNFYIDGQLQQGRQAGIAADGTERRSFALPRGRRARIEVAALNASNVVEGQRQAVWGAVSGPVQDGALHIFAVGVQNYRDPQLNLGHSAADAQDVAQEIAARAKPMFKGGVFVAPVLVDAAASLDGLERGFASLQARLKPQDTLVIFLAGHGEAPAGQGYRFLPWDFVRGASGVTGEGLDETRLRRWLAQSPGQTLLLVDTCDAGGAVALFDGAYERLSRVSAKVLIGASRQGELAREGYQGHGVFTAALLRVMAKVDKRVEHGMTIDQRACRRVQRKRHNLAKLPQDGFQLTTLRGAMLTRSVGRRLDSRRVEINNLK